MKPASVLQQTDEKFLDSTTTTSTVGDGCFVLTSWSDGHNHIYLYSYDQNNPLGAVANLDRQLTKGDFEVAAIDSVDQSTSSSTTPPTRAIRSAADLAGQASTATASN